METKTCKCCGNTITRKRTDKLSAWKRRKYCDYSCATRQRNLDRDPDRGNPKSRCMTLLSKTIVSKEGCMEWQGAIGSGGYGQAIIDGVNWKVHRAVYNFLVAPVPEDMEVCHRCDNPSCINPEHLFLGTTSDNMKDMIFKGRGRRWGKPMLSRDTREKILCRVRDGISKSNVATEFNVSYQTVYNIVKFKKLNVSYMKENNKYDYL